MRNIDYASVNDIQVIKAKGPWHSKSGGKLNVLFALPLTMLDELLDFKNPAFSELNTDIRGVRSYTISEIPKDSIGGKEWHKARTEYMTVLAGAAILECVDLCGDEKAFILDGKTGIIIPPRILHSYQALEENTQLQVVANTLFIPGDPATHDTFPVTSFE